MSWTLRRAVPWGMALAVLAPFVEESSRAESLLQAVRPDGEAELLDQLDHFSSSLHLSLRCDLEATWRTLHEATLDAVSCRDQGRVLQRYMRLARFSGSAEFAEFLSDVFERAIQTEPRCFLETWSRLESHHKDWVAVAVRHPVYRPFEQLAQGLHSADPELAEALLQRAQALEGKALPFPPYFGSTEDPHATFPEDLVRANVLAYVSELASPDAPSIHDYLRWHGIHDESEYSLELQECRRRWGEGEVVYEGRKLSLQPLCQEFSRDRHDNSWEAPSLYLGAIREAAQARCAKVEIKAIRRDASRNRSALFRVEAAIGDHLLSIGHAANLQFADLGTISVFSLDGESIPGTQGIFNLQGSRRTRESGGVGGSPPSSGASVVPVDIDELEGLWQFPDRGVWIRIWPDGELYQCRTPAAGDPITSTGLFRGRLIFWSSYWPVQAASVEEEELVLNDGSRSFRFVRAARMGRRCAARSPRPEPPEEAR